MISINVYRKVTRKILTFYTRTVDPARVRSPPPSPLDATRADLDTLRHPDLESEKQQALANAQAELLDAATLYLTDRDQLLAALTAYTTRHSGEGRNPDNTVQHATRRAFDPHAEALRGLVKQVDLLYKLAARVADQGAELATDDAISVAFDRRATGRLIKQLDEQRKAAVEQMKQAVYFHRQMTWLHDRFPDAELVDVPGLVKLASRAEIEAADWSLTPGRYVGVAPPEEDEDLDFEQTLRDIHTELADLNREAAELAARIQGNFEELGA
jgi:type I restriction enzyme M protein